MCYIMAWFTGDIVFSTHSLPQFLSFLQQKGKAQFAHQPEIR